ncbi:tRNA (5-methylaminomethyl-2-thiouridine)(34)-methyltransferase MnmD [Roseofilum casamattae]|uniref:MnmC family methyltransferase n=1 Tax=Roseofilum casamattae BLCC-M143 TaxID=3022442 RepID=A0ABT7BTP8_9CYAN|nr:MnmC family methyltransferase [Roseofilum casamattae]MDJ1182559.1 MnmC family methyltransferase [Roseofilum casamattae BLCC-M143]
MTEFTPQPTGDGSWTFFSSEFGELFHSHHGAKQEAYKKFVEPTQLPQRAVRSQLTILDICYGLGYNSASALEAIWSIHPQCQITWIGLESDRRVAQMAIAHHFDREWPHSIGSIVRELAAKNEAETDNFRGTLYLGDARQTLQHLVRQGFRADAIFLDPFSPPTCPQLWTVEFLSLAARALQRDGYLATYSCAAAVRQALKVSQLQIGTTLPTGRKSPGTLARHLNEGLISLSQKAEEHLQTRAAVPYRDPSLNDSARVICDRRRQEQQTSPLELSTHWKKRWRLLENGMGRGIS